MRSVTKLMQGVMFVGQLGFMLVTPPLVLIYLASVIQQRTGAGSWVMLLAIVVGLLSAAGSARNLFKKLLKDTGASSKKTQEKEK